MAYTDQATLAADATFLSRVKVAVVKRAVAALGASPTSDVLALARGILADPTAYTAQVVWSIATDATVAAAAGSPASQASVTDAQIQTAVNSLLALYVR